MLRAVGFPDQDVRTVLDWYVVHLTERYVPKVQSAEGFRDKFPFIREAMARQLQDRPVVAISADALAVHKRLAVLKWPGTTHALLLPFVQLSLDRYAAVCEALRNTAYKHSRSVAYVRQQLAAPDTFVYRWFVDRFPLLLKYPNTRLASVAFAVDHKDFVVAGRRWMTEYCGRPNTWDDLIKEVM